MSFRNGRYRCWACNASGDSIDFTARLLGLDAIGAVERLNADFCLALPLHRKPTKAEAQAARRRLEVARAHKEFEEWRKAFISKLCVAFRVAHMALLQDMDKLTEREAAAIRWQACFEYWADTLERGTPEEQAQIYRERGNSQMDRESFERLTESGAFVPSGPFVTDSQEWETPIPFDEISTPDWKEPPCLYCVALAPPGERKTAVISALTKPIYEYEAEQREIQAMEIAQNQTERALLEKALEAAKHSVARSKAGGGGPGTVHPACAIQGYAPLPAAGR